nr:hypothetical protein [uncultured Dyadobacter sp.]
MTTDAAVIEQVLKATHFRALATTTEPEPSYKELLKLIHPDKSAHPQAQEATLRLIALHEHYTRGSGFSDDSGNFVTNDYELTYQGDSAIIGQGRACQQSIYANAPAYLKKYMPYQWLSDHKLVFGQRAVPMADLTLPQEHVNWVVSRLLEFCMLLHHHAGQVHLGLLPPHIFIVPETHGIAVAGFYHTTQAGHRVKTISAGYRHWYPGEVFTEKVASGHTDLEMVKRIGAYLLGDRSGLGTALIRTHHREYVDFLLGSDQDAFECYEKYRTMLDNNFEKQFIHLNI